MENATMDNKKDILQRFFSLEGKIALVTGSSSGIGREIAVSLAEAGAIIAVHGRDQDRILETCKIIDRKHGKASPFKADLMEIENCRKLTEDIYKAFGRIDILVNCASINRRKPIREVTLEDFDDIVSVNLKSLYFLSQAIYPIMKSQGGGKIINIGSLNMFYGLDTVSVYGMTKGGIGQLTKVMAVEWAADNIQINSIVPGFIDTPLIKPLLLDEKKEKWIRNRIPARRLGNTAELVGVAILLSSDASSYITGQNFIVDGGFLAGGSWNHDEI
ncbi:MAG: SDR family oxidoreductase [Bacteroidales bacterium]|nr:SDR family oxidoreductase [Bacteroidales bacterium]HES59958.1 SDR family oxidoreductase [Caldithrix sp.]